MIDSSTKRKLADAFCEVLSQKPFAAIKVKDIVDAAGVSHMTFYRSFSDKYDLVERICYEDMMLFTKIYGRNAEWKAITICILNTVKNNAPFYSKILRDAEASESYMRAMARVSNNLTGACGSKSTNSAWKETMQDWARNGFEDSVEDVYIRLVGTMPLHEVFTGEQLLEAIKGYESNTLDDFRNRQLLEKLKQKKK